jgi:hypothetical protein
MQKTQPTKPKSEYKYINQIYTYPSYGLKKEKLTDK